MQRGDFRLDKNTKPADESHAVLRRFINLIKESGEAAESERRALGLEREPRPDRLKIAAFTDPNDLFSYELEPNRYSDTDVINVIVSNDLTWLGYLENPLAAHEGYRENENVQKFIACGKRKGETGPVSEEDCRVQRP